MSEHIALAFGDEAVELLVGFGDVVVDEKATGFVLLGKAVEAAERNGDLVADAAAVEHGSGEFFDFECSF